LPEFGYSFKGYDPTIQVRASGREDNVSPKGAREICNTIKGMKITRAIQLLEEVEEMKSPVAFRRYKLKVGHRSELSGFPSGSYPVKAAGAVLAVLRNLQSNCEFKGLDPERVKIIHSAAYPGRVIRDYISRAFGRSSPNFHRLIHIELVGQEV
jgi:large subunit ribosomal protein L22